MDIIQQYKDIEIDDSCPRKNKDNCDYIDANSVDTIVYSVLKKFTERAKVGKEKYKTDLDRTDLNMLDWIKHTSEELMDATLYLEKLKREFENIELKKIELEKIELKKKYD